MKKTITKMIAFCLCAVLTICGIVYTVYTPNVNADDIRADENVERQAALSDRKTADSETSGFKDETVYVLSEADGSVQEIVVSDWLKNAMGDETLHDKTDLTDIENIKGEEGYTTGSDHSCVWDAQGNDIYYQGKSDKELPVAMTVSYKLDGKTVTSSEIAGKSGKVTIRFDYSNQQYEYVEINGKKEKLYVPFAMLTGVLLDNAVFSNVEVTNGKLINDGDRTVVIGIAFPGMQENLAVSAEQLEIPDYVEITGDVENFKLDMTVTLATNEIFNEIDTDHIDSVDDLGASLGELTDAMDQLMDGSTQLYEGLSALLSQSGTLVDGVGALASGADTLKNGIGDLDEGAVSLQSGAEQLYNGLNTLAANNESLNGGAGQVFVTLLQTANTQLAASGLEVPELTIGNYADVLNGVIASLDENAVYEQALAAVTAAVEAQRAYIEEQVTAAVREEVRTQVEEAVKEQVTAQVTQAVQDAVAAQVISAAAQMSKEDYEAAVANGLVDEETQSAIQAAITQQMQSDEVIRTIDAQVNEQMNSETVKATVETNVSEQMQSDTMKETIASNTELQVQKAISDNMASEEVQSQLTAASQGAQAVISLKASLDSYNAFYLGLQSYTAGVAQAAEGAGELKTGMDTLAGGADSLYAGAGELYNGILTLKNSTPALIEGITALKNGALQLSDGLVELNEQGIQKLVDAVDGDLDGLVERLRAIKTVSRGYRTFTGLDDSMEGQVKFIYRTGSIE